MRLPKLGKAELGKVRLGKAELGKGKLGKGGWKSTVVCGYLSGTRPRRVS